MKITAQYCIQLVNFEVIRILKTAILKPKQLYNEADQPKLNHI